MIARAFAIGAAAALGAILTTIGATILGVIVVDALARGAWPRALQRELRGRIRSDDVRDRLGAH